MSPKKRATGTQARRARAARPDAFDMQSHLATMGESPARVIYRRGAPIFAQGDFADDIRYIQQGGVKLSVVSHGGREAVVAMLGPGDFFGEGVLAGHTVRMGTATALFPSVVLCIKKSTMVRLLHEAPAFADRFISYMLSRNMRIEADLIDQLFNSTEKRLARTLLLLAQYGQGDSERILPKVSQETLAEMVGSTRSRVNVFMNKFRTLGLIEYNGTIKVNSSLLSIVLHD